MKKDLLLQINIPFCPRRCSYCADKVCRADASMSAAYVKALLKQIEAEAPEAQDYCVSAISLEGGCPSLIEPSGLQTVIRAVKKNFNLAEDVQISLQTLPGDYSRALMDKMRDNGVNFWIVGLETTNMREHELLKRPYRFDAITMVDTALNVFKPRDLSFDLLCGIPGQTEISWERTLDAALAYDPDHITIYPLRCPAGSELKLGCETGLLKPLSAEDEKKLLTIAREKLNALGYGAYTRFDYCKPGKENRFRLGQLKGTEQLGIGYNSLTIMDGFSYRRGHSLQEYLEHSDDLTVVAADVSELTGKALEELERIRAELLPD